MKQNPHGYFVYLFNPIINRFTGKPDMLKYSNNCHSVVKKDKLPTYSVVES
jgi:hypothetical protein